jgi:hypothetical protein
MSTFITFWMICGGISAVWHTLTGNHMYETLEYGKLDAAFHMIIVAILTFVTGPISLVVKIYEDFIDTV